MFCRVHVLHNCPCKAQQSQQLQEEKRKSHIDGHWGCGHHVNEDHEGRHARTSNSEPLPLSSVYLKMYTYKHNTGEYRQVFDAVEVCAIHAMVPIRALMGGLRGMEFAVRSARRIRNQFENEYACPNGVEKNAQQRDIHK